MRVNPRKSERRSWGATWLEPLVEVQHGESRIAYGNVTPSDVDSLFESNFLEGGDHERKLGNTQEIEYLISQDRWTYFRCGLIEALSLEDYELTSGFKALELAFEQGAEAVIDAVTESGLRGRSDRHQVANRRRHGGRSEIHHLQCRRR